MAKIKLEAFNQTVTAFTSDGELAMNFGRPCVTWGFSVRRIEEWLITLEECMACVPSQRDALFSLYASLLAAHERHQEQHEEIVTSAPSGDDLMNYLAAYALSIANGVS